MEYTTINELTVLRNMSEHNVNIFANVLNDKFQKGLIEDEDFINKAFSELDNLIEKAKVIKYFKRLGTPGNYKYYYTEADYNKAKKETFTYKPSKDLKGEDKKIEKKFGNELTGSYDKYKKTYLKKFGNVLNTDDARELSPDYVKDRTRSAAVHEPASAFTKKMYEDLLETKIGKGKDTVFFMAGGTGSGKTSGVQGIKELNILKNKSKIVYDSNMNKMPSAIKKIEQALDKGNNVNIAFVYRDPVEAFVNGMIPRMIKRGRSVPINSHVDTHIGSLNAIKELSEKYKDNKNLKIIFIDNSRGKDNSIRINLDDIKKKPIFTKEKLTKELIKTTKNLRENGTIGERQEKAIIGA